MSDVDKIDQMQKQLELAQLHLSYLRAEGDYCLEISQEQYDDAEASVKHWQLQLADLITSIEKLQHGLEDLKSDY